MPPSRYDLEDRLIRFAARACRFADRLPSTPAGRQVALQLVRCVTSPFANYGEAQAAESRKDFVHKMRLCLKELHGRNAAS
ncbi:MAG: four helix bundle protein [Gemmatimonadales bacterium]